MNEEQRIPNPDVNSLGSEETDPAVSITRTDEDEGRIDREMPSKPDKQPELPTEDSAGIEDAPEKDETIPRLI